METLIFFGLFALVGLALLPARQESPPIVVVVAEPQTQSSAGCLPAILIFIALVLLLWLGVGA